MRKVFLREKKSAKKVFTEGGGINVMFKILYKSHSIMRGIFCEKNFSQGKKNLPRKFSQRGVKINVMFKILYKSHSIMRGIFVRKVFLTEKKIGQESFHRGGEN